MGIVIDLEKYKKYKNKKGSKKDTIDEDTFYIDECRYDDEKNISSIKNIVLVSPTQDPLIDQLVDGSPYMPLFDSNIPTIHGLTSKMDLGEMLDYIVANIKADCITLLIANHTMEYFIPFITRACLIYKKALYVVFLESVDAEKFITYSMEVIPPRTPGIGVKVEQAAIKKDKPEPPKEEDKKIDPSKEDTKIGPTKEEDKKE